MYKILYESNVTDFLHIYVCCSNVILNIPCMGTILEKEMHLIDCSSLEKDNSSNMSAFGI